MAEQSELVTFLASDRQNLEQAGYQIYSLSGQSVGALIDGYSVRFYTPSQRNSRTISQLNQWEFVLDSRARLSEVAINPEIPFVPFSNDKSLSEQGQLLAGWTRSLQSHLVSSSIQANWGSLGDIVEIAALHHQQSGQFLWPVMPNESEDYMSMTRTDMSLNRRSRTTRLSCGQVQSGEKLLMALAKNYGKDHARYLGVANLVFPQTALVRW